MVKFASKTRRLGLSFIAVTKRAIAWVKVTLLVVPDSLMGISFETAAFAAAGSALILVSATGYTSLQFFQLGRCLSDLCLRVSCILLARSSDVRHSAEVQINLFRLNYR